MSIRKRTKQKSNHTKDHTKTSAPVLCSSSTPARKKPKQIYKLECNLHYHGIIAGLNLNDESCLEREESFGQSAGRISNPPASSGGGMRQSWTNWSNDEVLTDGSIGTNRD